MCECTHTCVCVNMGMRVPRTTEKGGECCKENHPWTLGVHTHKCMHIHVHACTLTLLHIYTHSAQFALTGTHMHMYTHTQPHMHSYTNLYTLLGVRIHTHMFTCAYIEHTFPQACTHMPFPCPAGRHQRCPGPCGPSVHHVPSASPLYNNVQWYGVLQTFASLE